MIVTVRFYPARGQRMPKMSDALLGIARTVEEESLPNNLAAWRRFQGLWPWVDESAPCFKHRMLK
jgi:hypothetical protein